MRGRYEVAAASVNDRRQRDSRWAKRPNWGSPVYTPSQFFLTNRPRLRWFRLLLIDFVMQNVGLSAIDTSTYRFTLSDGLGNQYALNPIASRLETIHH